ncbi:MAG: hypothetical protein ABF289_18255 [Clostridiales bacterium]
MSMAEFNALMNHDVILKKMVRSYEGELSVDSFQVLKGCVEFGSNLIIEKKDNPGETLLAKAIVFLKDDAVIDVEHEGWEVEQTAPQIISKLEVINIDPIIDKRSGQIHHYELAVI